MTEKLVSFKNHLGEELSGYLHHTKSNSKNGVILTHCFTCSKHIKVIRKMCDCLVKNYTVLRFDFAGSGESEGKFEDSTYSKQIEDYNHAIKFLKSEGIESIGSLGHSMGAAIAILAGSKNANVSTIVTLGGNSSTQGIEDAFDEKIMQDIKTKGICTFKMFGREITLTKEFFNDARTHSISQTLKESKKPIFIIHGDKDKIVNVDNAKKLFFYANDPKELKIIPGGNHMFTNDLEETIALARKWFEKYLG